MKERPILFSGAMVRAILDGRKTQTRRVMKPQPFSEPELRDDEFVWDVYAADELSGSIQCLNGNPMDRLWVREAFSVNFCGGFGSQSESGEREIEQHFEIQYRAGGDAMNIELDHYDEHLTRLYDTQRGDWRPSIHMPRRASRITLEITDVRVERLQDISAEDAKAEGCQPPNLPAELTGVAGDYIADERTSFAILWNRINGPGSWSTNPWVWVVEFRRLEDEQ